MADDDKKGYGLVQPPAAVSTDDNMPDRRSIIARSIESRQPKTAADMPLVSIPDRDSPRSLYRGPDDEASSFGPPRPTPAEMAADKGAADFARHQEEAKQFGPPRPTPEQLASDKAIAQRTAQRALRNDVDIEIDEHGNVTSPPKPWTLQNAGDRVIYGLADAIKPAFRQRSELEKAQLDAALAQAKLKTEMVTAPAAMIARQASPVMDAMGKALDMQRVHYRQPIQMEREFSNDADKEAYIAKVKAAMANAAKK